MVLVTYIPLLLKQSSGRIARFGMMGSKQYFNIAAFKVKNAEELAQVLRGKV